MDLSAREIETAKFTFSVYDFDGTGIIDMYYLGPALRALNLTPSLSTIANLGGTKRQGEKTLKVEEFLAIYGQAKKVKDSGTMEDFLECLRSNDKDGNGEISSDQLGHLLQSYGERMDPEEVAEIIRECGHPSAEGLIAYVPFVKELMDGPDGKKSQPSSSRPRPQPAEVEAPVPIENNVAPQESQSTSNADEVSASAVVKPTEKPKDANAAFTIKVPPKQRSTSVIEEPKTPEAATAAFTLKSPKRSPSITAEDSKKAAVAAAEASLKPKNQMPLISMKTKGLIGHMTK